MEKTIKLEKRKVTYTLRTHKHVRGVRLSVACGGVLTVTASSSMRQGVIDAFIAEKSAWILEKLAYFSRFPRRMVVKNRRRHFIQYREKAREVLEARLAHWNRFYGLAWRTVSIKNQKSRWGSASRAGNLNFNYKLVLLPPALVDYVIVHELCHLKELNHSPRFWALVAKTIPHHRALRKELRRIGVSFL